LYLYNASGKLLSKSTGVTGDEKISLLGRDAGTYYLLAYNSKNVSTGVPYTLTLVPPTKPDLTFHQPSGWSNSVIVAASSSATKGKTTFSTTENVSLRFALKGTENLEDVFIQDVYLDGEYVTSFEVNGLFEEVADGIDFTCVLGKLSTGVHTISVKLDAENTVGESDENNNEQTVTITVLESKDDEYEANDSRAKASNLGTIASSQTYSNLVAGMFANQDWYKFTLAEAGTSNSSIELTYAHNSKTADVNLYLYNASGKQLATSTGATGAEKISLAGLAAGTYYVKAYNVKNVSNDVDYSLTITAKKPSSALSVEKTLIEPKIAEASLFRDAFEDSSFTPYEEDVELDFVQELYSTFDKSELFDDKYFA